MIQRRTILLVAPSGERRARLRRALGEGGFAVDGVAPEPRTSEVLDAEAAPELVIVDAAGIGESAWELTRGLSGGPLILLVEGARDIKRAFEAGAEDVVLAEAHPDEIVARADAVLRRTAAGPEEEGGAAVYVDRRLWINYASRQVWVRGEPAQLTPREFRLLRHLVAHRDRTLGHDDILASVWGREPSGGRPSEVLKQYVWRLRQKIEADPEAPEIVVTVPGAGYRFVSAA